MPIYEYRCNKCGESSDLRLSMFHRKKDVKCPKCGSDDVERVYSSSFIGESSKGDSCSNTSFG